MPCMRWMVVVPMLAGAAACASPWEFPIASDGSSSAGGSGGAGTSAGEPDLGLDADAVTQKPCPKQPPGYCVPGVPELCYDGPPGTEGVGSCAAGLRWCSPSGSAFGECQDQILPRPDNCAQPTSWVCDGEPATCGVLQFGEVLGAGGLAHNMEQVAWDRDSGWVRARVEMGALSGRLVIEHLVDEQILWSTSFDIEDDDRYHQATALVVDGQGATVVAANTEGHIALGGAPAKGPGALLLKLDAAGDLVWSQIVPSIQVQLYDVAIGPDDDIWVAGQFSGDLDFGGALLSSADSDGFLLRLDSDGSPIWGVSLDSATGAGLFSVTVGQDGTSYVGGYDDDSHKSCNHAAVLLAAYDAGGTMLWKQSHWSERSWGLVTSLALDDAGQLYAAGRLNTDLGNSIDLGGGPLDGTTFVAKFATNGQHIWSRGIDDLAMPGGGGGGHVAVDALGHVIVATTLQHAPHLRSYDADAHLLWTRLVVVDAPPPVVQNGGISVSAWGLNDFAMRPDGTMAIVGSYAGTIDLGDGPHNAVSGWDGFFAVYVP